jgi:hypothetical protein
MSMNYVIDDEIDTSLLIPSLVFTDETGETQYRILDMTVPQYAVGHGEVVARTILQSGYLDEDAELVMLESASTGWRHVAVGVVDPVTQEMFVHDYTMRQFSSGFSFPEVLHEDLWAEVVENLVNEGPLRLKG